MNTVGDLREVWPRLSGDERRLFDVIARSYLAALMPDFRYRQTTVTLDVAGPPVPRRWAGSRSSSAGGPPSRTGSRPRRRARSAQLLPTLRDGEAALLRDAAVEAKETRPPPRYNEGTLIEAMQNAWRFVEDEALQERLKEAKGIGTPATRAEIIRGLKAQDFLTAQGKHIVPTERGLSLFGVLERADPALVDPGVTAQMERLLDEVLVGQQEMEGADRCRLCPGQPHHRPAAESGAAAPLPGPGARRPCPAPFRRLAPTGRPARRWEASSKAWRAAEGSSRRPATRRRPRPAAASSTGMRPAGAEGDSDGQACRPSAAQQLFAEGIAQERGTTVPEEAKASIRSLSAWIDANRSKPGRGPPKVIAGPAKPVASRSLRRGPRMRQELLLPQRWARR